MKKFKEKCDLCHKWKTCHGYENKILCEKCILIIQKEKVIKIVGDKDGQARFDF